MLNLLRLLMLLTAMCFALVCDASAQEKNPQITQIPQITIKEQLQGGEYIVVIDGVEQRTVTADHARKINQLIEDLDKCQRARAVMDQAAAKSEQLIALSKKDAQLAQAQATIERERAGRFEAMYNGEHELRMKAESDAAHGRGNWFTKLFDNPYVGIGFKAIVPTANMIRAFSR